MKMPQEIEVWFVIPAVRSKLAKSMINKGATQRKIAAIMGITEAAVSQYVKGKRAVEVKLPLSVKKEIDKSADIILQDETKYMCEMNRIMRLRDVKKIVCKLHKNDVDKLPAKCKACLEY